jgi:hypothetical protein
MLVLLPSANGDRRPPCSAGQWQVGAAGSSERPGGRLVLLNGGPGRGPRRTLARLHTTAPDSRMGPRDRPSRQREPSGREGEKRSPNTKEKHRCRSRREPDADEANRGDPEGLGNQHQVDEERRQCPGDAHGRPKQEKTGLGSSPGHDQPEAEGGLMRRKITCFGYNVSPDSAATAANKAECLRHRLLRRT